MFLLFNIVILLQLSIVMMYPGLPILVHYLVLLAAVACLYELDVQLPTSLYV